MYANNVHCFSQCIKLAIGKGAVIIVVGLKWSTIIQIVSSCKSTDQKNDEDIKLKECSAYEKPPDIELEECPAYICGEE